MAPNHFHWAAEINEKKHVTSTCLVFRDDRDFLDVIRHVFWIHEGRMKPMSPRNASRDFRMAFDTSSHPGSSKEYEGAGMSTVMGATPLHSGSSKKCRGMGAWSVMAGGQAS